MRYPVAALVVVLCGCGPGAGDLPGVTPRPGTVLAAPALVIGSHDAAPGPDVDDVWVLHDHLVNCLVRPLACDVASVTAEHSSARHQLTDAIESRRHDGLEAWAPTWPPRRTLRRSEPTGSQWFVELCWLDDLVLQEAGASPARSVVVDDGVLTLVERWTLSHTSVGWRVATRTIVEIVPGGSPSCR